MEKRVFYRVREIEELSGISRFALYAAVHRQEIKSVTIGKNVYIPSAEVERILGASVVSGEKGDDAA